MKLTREGHVFYPTEPCEGLEEKILLMQAGGLSDPEEKQLMSHIETCGACKTLYRHYELIDENIRDHLAAQQNRPPQSMPKKLRIMLSEAGKQHFASRLQELGHSILFQKPEVCDLIRPWTPPQPLDRCVKMLNNSCNSLLKDPFIEEVGVKPEFVEDCRRYLGSLVENPAGLMDVESAKETLDRAFEVDPDYALTLKSLYDFFLLRRDNSSAGEECKRLLKLKLAPQNMYRNCINLSSNLLVCKEYVEATQYLDLAEGLNSDFTLYFMRFKLHYLKLYDKVPGSWVEPAVDNLNKMDHSIEIDDMDSEAVILTSKWFQRNIHGLRRYFKNNQSVKLITNKYTESILGQGI